MTGGFGDEIMDVDSDDEYYGSKKPVSGGGEEDSDDDIDTGRAVVNKSTKQSEQKQDDETLAEYAAAGGSGMDNSTVASKQSEYQTAGRNSRVDAFQAEDGSSKSYAEVMKSQELDRETKDLQDTAERIREEKNIKPEEEKKSRWDAAPAAATDSTAADGAAKPRRRRWDATPSAAEVSTTSKWGETPVAKVDAAADSTTKKRSR